MGAWGWGNLESDGSQDVLAEICDGLFARVTQLLRHPSAHEYDEIEFNELLVRLEMIFALQERGMINTAPNPQELESLCAAFLERWAGYYFRASKAEPAVEWRRVIERSFARLVEIAGKACAGSFEHRIDLIMDVMAKPTPDEKSGPS